MGVALEEVDVVFVVGGFDLFDHEFAEVALGDVEGFELGYLVVAVGGDGVVVDFGPGGCNDEDGHDEGEADEYLIGGEGGGAQGLAEEGHDNDDACEAGGHEEDGGGEGEDGEEEEDLDGGGKFFGFGGGGDGLGDVGEGARASGLVSGAGKNRRRWGPWCGRGTPKSPTSWRRRSSFKVAGLGGRTDWRRCWGCFGRGRGGRRRGSRRGGG